MTDISAGGALFRNQGYVRVWLIGLCCGIVRWLEMLAFGIYAFDVTGSPALVSLMVMLRFLPLALFGVVMGALADLINPLRLMIIGLVLVALLSIGMFALFVWGEAEYWHVAVAAFLSGMFWASDMPFRRKLMAEFAGTTRLASAIGFDGATSNGTRMLGPLLGGVIYQTVGTAGVFALGATLYLAALAVALGIRYEFTPAEEDPGRRLLRPLRGAVAAFRYAMGRSDVKRILATTVAYNIWGFPFLAMVPVIGKDLLGLAPGAVGAVTALEGACALIGALTVGWLARPGGFRMIYYGATALVFCVVAMIGAFPGFWTLTVGLALAGLCTASFATMQGTLIYLVAPAEMRGRFLGLMTICIGAGVIGFANVGLTAELFGASNALWIIALEGMIPLALIGRGWRELRRG